MTTMNVNANHVNDRVSPDNILDVTHANNSATTA